MRIVVVVMLLAGCRQILGIDNARISDGGGGDDTPDGTSPEASVNPLCFGAPPFDFCLPSVPTGNATLPTGTLSTTTCTGSVITIGGISSCVLAADTISVPNGFTNASGTRPLVLVATTTISISGYLVGSAGANPTSCGTASIAGTGNVNGGGGGGGGSFSTKGANGGAGGGGATGGGIPPNPVGVPTTLRGGCSGGLGGTGGAGSGTAGIGGGAIYLVTHGTLNISGAVSVSGSGGGGGMAPKGGGGGGGSGGLLVIHAAIFNFTGYLSSNGGGGGAGAGTNDNGDPGLGTDVVNPFIPADGGQSTTLGRAEGGDGAATTTQATPGLNGANGGGAGGGGLGYIRVMSPANKTFPPQTTSPTPIN